MIAKNSQSLKVKCPKCQKSTLWHHNPFRPFCSERCQTCDQAAWVSEEYTIPQSPNQSDVSSSDVEP